MTIYLGPPGNLQALPYMGRGIGAPLDLGASVHRSLGGVRTVDYVGDPKRTYSLERKFLTQDELSLLEGLALGAYGDPSTLVLLDPFRRNMLAENQATAGDYSRDTTGFYAYGAGAGVPTLQGPSVVAGGRGLYRIRTVTPAAGNAGIGLANTAGAVVISQTAIPVVPNLTYTLSGLIRSVAGTPQLWRPVLRFYDLPATTNVGNSVGAAAVSTGSLVQRTVTGVAPATAAYLVPTFDVSALAASDTLEVEDLMLTQGTSTVWAMGTGVPRVAFTGALDLSYPDIVGANDLSITLQEVA